MVESDLLWLFNIGEHNGWQHRVTQRASPQAYGCPRYALIVGVRKPTVALFKASSTSRETRRSGSPTALLCWLLMNASRDSERLAIALMHGLASEAPRDVAVASSRKQNPYASGVGKGKCLHSGSAHAAPDFVQCRGLRQQCKF